MSSTERDLDEETDEQSRTKRSRADTPQSPALLTTEAAASEETGSTPQVDSEGVKEVTKGVKEVELEEKEKKDETSAVAAEDDAKENVAPESVPLPQEVSGELDETSSIASTPPAGDTDEVEEAPENEGETEELSGVSTQVEPEDDEEEITSAERLTDKDQVSI